MLKFLIILLITPAIAFGCCGGPFPSITEILNHNDKHLAIFTCTIVKTYIRNSSYESVAIVNKKFGNIDNDTIYIRTGGFSTAGGRKLIPDSEWLIFAFTNDKLHYNATVCEHNSSLIKSNNPNVYKHLFWDKGQDYLRIVLEHEKIKTSKFTGYKTYYIKNNKVAEGYYNKGKAHGKWIHYSRYDKYESGIIKSIIHYNNGKYHGDFIEYYGQSDSLIISTEKKYNFDKILYSKTPHNGKIEYTYNNNNDRISKSTSVNKQGEVYKIVNLYQKYYENLTYFSIYYKEGYYFNKNPNSYEVLGEGYYYRGARVGNWKYFNKKGEFIKSEFHDYPDTTNNDFATYNDEGEIIISGKLDGTKRVGIWKRYKAKITYSSDGELINKYRTLDNGQKIFTPYKNFKKHGYEIVLSKNSTIKRITPYKNGQKSGTYLTYDDEGNINEEIYYYKNRKTTKFNKNKGRNYINGYLEGDYIQLDHRTGKVVHKGTYWKGYLIGEQINYNRDGSYQINTYSTDTIKLMNLFFEESPKSTTKYDKNGNLIKVWQN